MSGAVPGPLVVLTDRLAAARAGRTLLDAVGAALDAGAPAVLVREKDLARDERAALCAPIVRAARERGACVGIASDDALAADLGVDWVHLAARDALPRSRPAVLGRSAHDLASVRACASEGCDYASVSPVLETASKPGYGPALGIAGLGAVVRSAALPVVALGGLGARPDTAAAARRAGAAAVWVMGAVMGAGDPGAVVHALLDEIAAPDEAARR